VAADAGDGHGFEPEVVGAAVDHGGHGFGDVKHGEEFSGGGEGRTLFF
jgi:hypothetical protein